MLLVIGWRGEPGKKDEPQHVKQGQVTLTLLEAMGIDYEILAEDYVPQIDRCCNYMAEQGKPIALVVQAGSFDKYSVTKAPDLYTMKREEALENILSEIEEDSFLVSTTGKTSREIFEIREKRAQGHERDFLTVGSMGHTASIALGMSLGSDKNIYCIDGDGSFLMHMGGMGVAAKNAPDNFKYILINNGAHESVGGQPTIGFDIDVEGVLESVGFDRVIKASTPKGIIKGIAKLKKSARCALVIYVNQGSRADLGRPTVGPEDNKKNMMKAFAAGRKA
jgi:phosphonopyruvate decarboxylase